jgi:hypothetical protein
MQKTRLKAVVVILAIVGMMAACSSVYADEQYDREMELAYKLIENQSRRKE